MVISNTYTFFVWGYAYKWFDVVGPSKKVIAKRLVTSGAQFMTNRLSQFLIRAQFNALPNNCFLKKLWITLNPIGLEASFQTGGTLSASASISHVPMLIYTKGANLGIAHEPVTITSESTKSMKISKISSPSSLDKVMWGSTAINDFPSCLTVPRNWPIYDSFIIPSGKSDDNGNLFSTNEIYGAPRLNKLYEQGVAAKAVDGNVSFKYEPRIGVIKSRKQAHGWAFAGTDYDIGSNSLPGRYTSSDSKKLNEVKDKGVKALKRFL